MLSRRFQLVFTKVKMKCGPFIFGFFIVGSEAELRFYYIQTDHRSQEKNIRPNTLWSLEGINSTDTLPGVLKTVQLCVSLVQP